MSDEETRARLRRVRRGMRRARAVSAASAVALLASAILLAITGQWWSALTFMSVAVVVVCSLYVGDASFVHGWFAGRNQMLRSMSEAMQRDMSLNDWIIGEFERDDALLRQRRGWFKGPSTNL